MTIENIIRKCEEIAPPKYALDWDNVGLLVGDKGKKVKKIAVSLDATEAVVERAIKEEVDLLLTHHPMIFRGVKKVNTDDLTGRKIWKLANHGIAQYAMHTNFDVSKMADLAAKRFALKNIRPLEVTTEEDQPLGIGAVGEVFMKDRLTVKALAEIAKKEFSIPSVFVYGNVNELVSVAAICPGSGRSEIAEAIKQGAQVLITGDIGHHEGIDAADSGLNIIDATHYGLEHIFVDYMTDELKTWFSEIGEEISVIPIDTGSPITVL